MIPGQPSYTLLVGNQNLVDASNVFSWIVCVHIFQGYRFGVEVTSCLVPMSRER